MLDTNKTYIKFDESCLDYITNDKEANMLYVKAALNSLTRKFSYDQKIFINDILREIGAEEIDGGWDYGLMKGKTISPYGLEVSYSNGYVMISLNGFIPVSEIYDDIYPSYIVEV